MQVEKGIDVFDTLTIPVNIKRYRRPYWWGEVVIFFDMWQRLTDQITALTNEIVEL